MLQSFFDLIAVIRRVIVCADNARHALTNTRCDPQAACQQTMRFFDFGNAQPPKVFGGLTHNPTLFCDSAPFWFLRRFCLWRKLGGKASLVFAVKTFFNSTSKSRNTVILDTGWQRANGVVLTIAYFIKPPFCFSAFARQNNGS